MRASIEGGVVQVTLSAHHPLSASSGKTPLHVRQVLDVAVRYQWYLDCLPATREELG